MQAREGHLNPFIKNTFSGYYYLRSTVPRLSLAGMLLTLFIVNDIKKLQLNNSCSFYWH